MIFPEIFARARGKPTGVNGNMKTATEIWTMQMIGDGTTANESDQKDYIEILEREITAGSRSAMALYAKEGLANHIHDREEMRRRLSFLSLAENTGDRGVIWAIGLLAAAANVRRTYELIVKGWGEDIHPLFPYYVYLTAEQSNPDQRPATEWLDALQLSADLGAIPARIDLMAIRMRKKSIPGYCTYMVARCWFWVLEKAIRLRNPKDKRLPLAPGEQIEFD